jgi:beta propeller repeat protein
LVGGIPNWEIFLYDLSFDSDNDSVPHYLENSTKGGRPYPDPAKIRISNNVSMQLSPKIYGDTIVWEDKRHGNWDIYIYDLAEDLDGDGEPNYLDDDDDNDSILDGNDTDSDPAEIRITDHPAHQENPDIYGSKIVWEDARYGNKDVFMYDLISQEESVIVGLNELGDARDRPWQRYPRIYGDKIVWQDDGYTSIEICMYNLSKDTDGDGIPNYLENDRPDPDPAKERITINLYDHLSNTEYKLTNSSTQQKIDSGPNVYGTKVVWSYDFNDSKDLYLYDLALDSDDDGEPNYMDSDTTYPDLALIRITNESERFSMISSIYTNKIVWQDSRNPGKPIDVYLFTLTENHPPEITNFQPNYTAEIKDDESLSFNITAMDPDDDELTYIWFLNDAQIPGANVDTYNFISDHDTAGIHEIRVVVSDGEYHVEKVWILYVLESNIEPPTIVNLNPSINPTIVEGGEISLALRAIDEDSEILSLDWTWDEDLLPVPQTSNTTSAGEINTKLSFTSLLDYNGSNYVKSYSITARISDGKHVTTHKWILAILYFDDADMDGSGDSYEITWNSDPLDATSTPTDLDKDFIVDAEDTDKDGDGFLDEDDAYPLDPEKQLDGEPDNTVDILLIILILILVVVAIVTLPKISKS